jgi:conserved hypothetical protein TIGR00250
MPRILALDYGTKRTGIAVSDPLQLIAQGLTTVNTSSLLEFLKNYMLSESVELIIIGLPKDLHNRDTDATQPVKNFIALFEKQFPHIPIKTVDERFSSKIAFQSMIDSGMKKKDRRNKATIDEVSATVLLQCYMESR